MPHDWQPDRGCQRKFYEPIPLPGGRQIVTLEDAGDYIANLPKNESALPEWQAAVEALMLVVEHGDPAMFARIGVMRALNRDLPAPEPDHPRRKRAKAYRIVK
jgi:hypothetical protein